MAEAGAVYLARINPLVEELELAKDEAQMMRQNPSGMLRISASVAFGQVCLLPLLPRFRAVLSGIQLDLQQSDQNVDLGGEGIDLAIRLAPAPKGDLISTRLKTTRDHVCAAPDIWSGLEILSTPGIYPTASACDCRCPRGRGWGWGLHFWRIGW